MRIVINGLSIECKNRSRIQIFDGLREISASMEVRSLSYILSCALKRKVARKQGVVPAVVTITDLSGPPGARQDEHPPVHEGADTEAIPVIVDGVSCEHFLGMERGCGHKADEPCPYPEHEMCQTAKRDAVAAAPVDMPAERCKPRGDDENACPDCYPRPGGVIRVKALDNPICMSCGRMVA